MSEMEFPTSIGTKKGQLDEKKRRDSRFIAPPAGKKRASRAKWGD